MKLLFKNLIFLDLVLAKMKSSWTTLSPMLKLLQLSSAYNYITTSYTVSKKKSMPEARFFLCISKPDLKENSDLHFVIFILPCNVKKCFESIKLSASTTKLGRVQNFDILRQELHTLFSVRLSRIYDCNLTFCFIKGPSWSHYFILIFLLNLCALNAEVTL